MEDEGGEGDERNEGDEGEEEDMSQAAVFLRAAESGETDEVARLLDAGVSIEVTNEVGHTALMMASINGKMDTMTLLLDRGANIQAKDEYNETAFTHASSDGNPDTMVLLLRRGSNIEDKDTDGVTSLMWASNNGMSDNVALLLRRGAILHTQATGGDHIGKTALDMARDKNREDVVTLLEKAVAEREVLRTLVVPGDSLRTVLEQASALANGLETELSTARTERDQAIAQAGELRAELKRARLPDMEDADLKRLKRSVLAEIRQRERLAVERVVGEEAEARLREKQSEFEEERRCQICCDADKDTSFACGHQACATCAAKITNCQVCRVRITERRRIYY
jgi:hypothetical protein